MINWCLLFYIIHDSISLPLITISEQKTTGMGYKPEKHGCNISIHTTHGAKQVQNLMFLKSNAPILVRNTLQLYFIGP